MIPKTRRFVDRVRKETKELIKYVEEIEKRRLKDHEREQCAEYVINNLNKGNT